MIWYDRLFAAMLARADGQQHDLYGDRKRDLFADVCGTVVEIGPGTGINLPYYPPDIHWIGAEPNEQMHPYISEKAARLGLDAKIHAATLAELALETSGVDAVISTLVLCSIADQDAVLAEIRRVLKPGGAFFFIEHIAAPEGTWLRRLQRGIRPLWMLVADGCRPDRDTHQALGRAGFSSVRYDRFDLDVFFSFVKPHIIGVAR